MKFIQVKQVLVALEDVPKKPSVFIDRLTWFAGGIVVGYVLAYLIVR